MKWRKRRDLRSNVSMGLKELQSWNLVRLNHLPNDRRKREIDPTLSLLRDALMEQPSAAADMHARERMRQMHGFIESMTVWLDGVQKRDSDTLASLMQMGSKVQKLLDIKDRVKQVFTGKPPAPTDAVPQAAQQAPALPLTGDDRGRL